MEKKGKKNYRRSRVPKLLILFNNENNYTYEQKDFEYRFHILY